MINTWWSADYEIIGVTIRSAIWRRITSTPRAGKPASRCKNSSKWSKVCTKRASRSFSMSSTTIRPKATIWGRSFHLKGSTMQPITAWSRMTAATTWTIRQQSQHAPSPRGAIDYGFVALLGFGDARRWLSLRSGGDLARELHDVDRLSAFFDLIQQDPVIRQVKLIAEPWDVGEGGYQVGKFPPLWLEWNGKYRDCVRDYWRGQDQTLGEFAYRFTGSSDLYEPTGRRPYASVNFVTAHDGFTAHDLVSYNEKHNEANGEENRDGESHNRSWNCGVEGPTDDPQINALRNRQKRNFLSTLFLSQGIPMLLGGDEIGRTQRGNNNAYCQDNEISWFHWESADQELLEFTHLLIQLRKQHPVFRRRKWFQGRPIHGAKVTDIGWFTPDGLEMAEEQWGEGFAKALGVFLNGEGINSPDVRGERVVDESFYVLFNAHYEPLPFVLPKGDWGKQWCVVLDTNKPVPEEEEHCYQAGDEIPVESRSVKVLHRVA